MAKDLIYKEEVFKIIGLCMEVHLMFRNVILPHKFCADFVVYDRIILEAKAKACIIDDHIAQTLNYLKVSKNKLALLVDFGRMQLEYKRLVF